MKRLMALALCLLLALGILCGCTPTDEVPEARSVAEIRIGAVGSGMTVGSIPISVTYNGQALECSGEWIVFLEDDYDLLGAGDQIPEDFYGQVDVSYILPAGTDLSTLSVEVDAPGGSCSGTGGDMNNSADEPVHAVSHIQYGHAPEKQASQGIVIEVGPVAPGASVGGVSVSATLDGKDILEKAVWIHATDEGPIVLSPGDVFPDEYWGRVDVYFLLPSGFDFKNCPVTLKSGGGTYDGTTAPDIREDGDLRASHIVYDFRTPVPTDVVIDVGAVTPGASVGSVPVSATLGGEDVFCRAEWSRFLGDGFMYLSAGDVFPEWYWGRVDVYYRVPARFDPAKATVTINGAEGVYDCTGDTFEENGETLVASHILFDFRPKSGVVIDIGPVAPGASVGGVPISVTLDGKEIFEKAAWICYTGEGFTYLSAGDVFPDKYWGRVDVYYLVPLGYEYATYTATLSSEGGVFDGTGSPDVRDDGLLLWSHVQYDFRNSDELVPEGTIEHTEHEHHWVQNTSKSKSPTCTEQGYTYYHCTECGRVYKKPLAALGHRWTAQWASPSQHLCTCVNCGATRYENHHVVNRKCTVCGSYIIN